jgi:hypothetical protein
MGRHARGSRSTTKVAAVAAATILASIAGAAGTGVAHGAPLLFNPNSYVVSGAASGGSGSVTVTVPAVGSAQVKIPSIAPQSLSTECVHPVDGKSNQVELAGINFGAESKLVIDDQTVDDTGIEQANSSAVGITEESKIEGLSALAGGITADTLDAVAHSTIDADASGGIDNHLASGDPAPSGLTVVNLDIFGQVLNGEIAPNTTVALPGSGNYVVLNQQTATATGLTVNALAIHLAAAGVFTGSLTVVHASTRVTPAPSGSTRYDGEAFAASLRAQVASVTVNSGEIAGASINCFGGSASNSVANIAIGQSPLPNLGDSGTATATVTAGSNPLPTITSSEDIEGLNLIGGLITADALDVTTTSSTLDGLTVSSTGGTTFTNLVINGQPIAANPAPNTKISVAGLGTITLNKQSCHAGPVAACTAMGQDRLTVTAISVAVNASNDFNLPLDTSLTVSQATAGLLL